VVSAYSPCDCVELRLLTTGRSVLPVGRRFNAVRSPCPRASAKLHSVAMTAKNQSPDTSSPPSKSKPSHDAGEGAALRKRSRSRGARRLSVDIEKSSELETAEDEDAGLRDEGGYKGRQVRLSIHLSTTPC
jgi:hypothetical protein